MRQGGEIVEVRVQPEDLFLDRGIALLGPHHHGIRFAAIKEQGLVDLLADPTQFGAANPELPIHVPVDHAPVVTAHVLPHAFAIKRGVGLLVGHEQRQGEKRIARPNLVGAAEKKRLGADVAEIGPLPKDGHGAFQEARRDQVVGIEGQDELPARQGHPAVAGLDNAFAFLAIVADGVTRVAGQDVLGHLVGIVRAAVVDEDRFPGAKALAQHALDAFPEIGAVIVTGDDDRDLGRSVVGRGGLTLGQLDVLDPGGQDGRLPAMLEKFDRRLEKSPGPRAGGGHLGHRGFQSLSLRVDPAVHSASLPWVSKHVWPRPKVPHIVRKRGVSTRFVASNAKVVLGLRHIRLVLGHAVWSGRMCIQGARSHDALQSAPPAAQAGFHHMDFRRDPGRHHYSFEALACRKAKARWTSFAYWRLVVSQVR